MAEQPVPEETWGKNIVKSITELNHTMGTLRVSYQKQNLYDIVTPFDGSSPAQCSHWLSSLNKFTSLHGNTSDSTLCKLAYMTARGPCSEFINRWNIQQAQKAEQLQIPIEQVMSWGDLKKNLLAHFSVVSDRAHAHDVLRKIRQLPGETLTFYAERIHRLAKDAYSVDDLETAASQNLAQRQLVNYFIDGLQDQSIMFRVLRKQPTSLDDALKVAREEYIFSKRFELRSPRLHQYDIDQSIEDEEDPMEVNYVCSNIPEEYRYYGSTNHMFKYRSKTDTPVRHFAPDRGRFHVDSDSSESTDE